jgi:WD40 repeat protein
VHTVSFSQDGRRLVTGGRHGTVRFWDTKTGRELLILTKHTGHVMAAALSPDGTHLATAGYPKTAIVWPLFPWAPAEYPGAHDLPLEDRIELYKRQLLKEVATRSPH